MTYSTLIEEARGLAYSLINTMAWDQGVVFSCANRAARRLAMITKDTEASGTITLTSGTTSYTISSALASDVDEINEIRIGDALVDIISVTDFERLTISGSTTSDSSVDTTFENVKCKIYNGVITFYPSPNATYTATVYYSKKQVIATVSTANLATDINLRDDYLNGLAYLTAAEMYKVSGDIPRGKELEAEGISLIEEARDHQPMVEFNGQVKFNDALS